MRPGLVVLGVVFAVIGAAVLVAIIAPGDDPSLAHNASGAIVDLPAGDTRSILLSAQAAGHTTISFSWTSDEVVLVNLFETKPCSTGTCAVTPALETWSGGTSGHWTASGGSVSGYEMNVEAWPSDPAPTNFTGFLSETYRASDLALPLIPFFVVVAGGAVLTGLGAVILYLGLFLPAGVYGPLDMPPPPETEDPYTVPDGGSLEPAAESAEPSADDPPA